MLSDEEIERYSRQIVLPEVGGRGQERLEAAAIGLYVAAATDAVIESAVLAGLHLAVAGVGRVVVDSASPSAARTEEALSRLTGERDPSIAIAVGCESTSVVACMAGLPATNPQAPVVCAVVEAGESVLVCGAAQRFCLRCWGDTLGERSTTSTWPSFAPPLVGALVATLSLRLLLGIGTSDGLATVAIGLGAARPRASSASRTCAACSRN